MRIPLPERPFEPRTVAAAVALLLMLIGGFELFYLRIYSMDRSWLRKEFTALPYRKLPGYRELLSLSAQVVPEGKSIALWLANARWKEGYEYAYHRMGYLVAGRHTVPLLDETDTVLWNNLQRTEYIVCWRCTPPFPLFKPVASSPYGTVSRRVP